MYVCIKEQGSNAVRHHICFLCSALEILQVHGVTLEKLIKAMPKQFRCLAEDSVLAGRMEIEG